jgi:hypothetical protein
MITERLLYQVEPKEFVKDFMQADADVWNPWLRQQQGFLNKSSRVIGPNQVELLLHWVSQGDLDRASSKTDEIKMVDYLLRQRSPGSHHLIHSSVF